MGCGWREAITEYTGIELPYRSRLNSYFVVTCQLILVGVFPRRHPALMAALHIYIESEPSFLLDVIHSDDCGRVLDDAESSQFRVVVLDL